MLWCNGALHSAISDHTMGSIMACGKTKWKERGSKGGPQSFVQKPEDTAKRKKKAYFFVLIADIFSALSKAPFLSLLSMFFCSCFNLKFVTGRQGKRFSLYKTPKVE